MLLIYRTLGEIELLFTSPSESWGGCKNKWSYFYYLSEFLHITNIYLFPKLPLRAIYKKISQTP